MDKILQFEDGLLVKVPSDMRKPRITQWSDNTTTLEFFSKSYVMTYSSDVICTAVDEKLRELKEITLPYQSEFVIIKTVSSFKLRKLLGAAYQKQLAGKDKWIALLKV